MSKKVIIAAIIGVIIIVSLLILMRTKSDDYCLIDSDCIAYDSCCGNYACVNKHAEHTVCNLYCEPKEEIHIPVCSCNMSRCTER